MDTIVSPSAAPVDFEYCDLVMKGGITSGVIYPAAAVELAKKFKFKNIGGTSAGAIAAAVVAAAELGRRRGFAGAFDVLGRLPESLAKDGHLFKLFTPDEGTRKVFKVAMIAAAEESKWRMMISIPLGLMAAERVVSILLGLVGLLLPSVLFSLAKWCSLLPLPGLVERHYLVCGLTGVALGLALALLGAAWRGGKDAVRAFANNDYGICSGLASQGGEQDSLTGWLDQQIQSAAGKTVADPPVTFGDLWCAPAYPGEALKTERVVNLEVVTTGITEGRPFSIPFLDGALYFDRKELSALFPERVVQALIDGGSKADAAANRARPEPQVSSPQSDDNLLYRIPANADLPILVATRMSLSFPGLLSAVPLYRVDYSLKRNQDKSGTVWKTRVGTKVWFSDGGICSNFPVNFFDSPIPRWPTFGINLQTAKEESCSSTTRPAANFVTMPKTSGAAPVMWNDLGDATWLDSGERKPQEDPDKCIANFGKAIFSTMQNWRDNLQASAPGFRERIVSVKLCKDEGGLNLDMPQQRITDLSARGQLAGQLLKGFDLPQHTFTRFRVMLCALQEYLAEIDRAMNEPNLPQDAEGIGYIRGTSATPPPHYKWAHANIGAQSVKAIDDLCALSQAWKDALTEGDGFCTGAPQPEGTMEIRPGF
jgi:predicted acylesterase/phospholipase RssA